MLWYESYFCPVTWSLYAARNGDEAIPAAKTGVWLHCFF